MKERMKGLWIAHFNVGAAHGDGIAVLREGEILGGDLAHTWIGTYQEEGTQLWARVRVAPCAVAPNGQPAVPERTIQLTLMGDYNDQDARLTGHPDESETPVTIEMHRAT